MCLTVDWNAAAHRSSAGLNTCCFSLLLHKELLEFYLSGKLFLLSVQFNHSFLLHKFPEALDVFNLFVILDCYDETVAEGLLADTWLPKVTASLLKGKNVDQVTSCVAEAWRVWR